jgi:hypothetical protein
MKNFTLEYLHSDKGNKFQIWTEVKLIGLSGEKDYLIERKINNSIESLTVKPENLRILLNEENIKTFTHSRGIFNSDEYEISENSYTPCEKKNQRGKFHTIEIKSLENHQDHNYTIITKIAREEELRTVSYFLLLDLENTEKIFSNNIFPVSIDSTNLHTITSSEGYKDLLSSLIETFPESEILIETFTKENENYFRFICPKEDAETIKLMIEITLENEINLLKMQNFEKKPEQSSSQQSKSIEPQPQQSNTSMSKIKHFISKDLVGLLIGARGANINRLKSLYNVGIKINSEIEGDKAAITITGNDQDNLQKCLEEVKLVKVSYELTQDPTLVEEIKKLNLALQEYADKYNLYRINITRDKFKKNSASYLNMIGKEESVRKAYEELKQYLI